MEEAVGEVGPVRLEQVGRRADGGPVEDAEGPDGEDEAEGPDDVVLGDFVHLAEDPDEFAQRDGVHEARGLGCELVLDEGAGGLVLAKVVGEEYRARTLVSRPRAEGAGSGIAGAALGIEAADLTGDAAVEVVEGGGLVGSVGREEPPEGASGVGTLAEDDVAGGRDLELDGAAGVEAEVVPDGLGHGDLAFGRDAGGPRGGRSVGGRHRRGGYDFSPNVRHKSLFPT